MSLGETSEIKTTNAKNQNRFGKYVVQLCKAADRTDVRERRRDGRWKMEGTARREWTDNVSPLFGKASSALPSSVVRRTLFDS